MTPESPCRLDSWKQIAAYLGKSISAVRRWEREEGLPVRRQEHLKRGSVVAFKRELDAWLAARTTPLPEEPPAPAAPASIPRRWAISAVAAAGALAWAGPPAWSWWKRTRPIAVQTFPNAREPSISPDGTLVALARGVDVSILNLRTGKSQPVARADAPKWSRDGKYLAYAKKISGTYAIAVTDAQGQNERIVREQMGPYFDWLPDGQRLVTAFRENEREPIAAYSLRLRDGQRRQLTYPPMGTWGDVLLAASFQGDRLALARYTDRGSGDVYVAKLDGSGIQRLTWTNTWINGLTFTPDGTEVVFAGYWEGKPTLVRIPTAGGAMRPVLGAPEGSEWPSFAAQQPHLLCFHKRHWESPLMTQRLGGDEKARHLFAGRSVERIQTSRDGQWLVGSTPKGLALFAADGSSWRPLTSGKTSGLSALSPDGRQVAFVEERGQRHTILVMPAGGGPAQPLTGEDYREGRPQWSADGRSLYFHSDREGMPGVFRIRWPERGTPERIERGGVEARESADGKLIYLLGHEQDSLLRVRPVDGDEWRLVDAMPKVEPGHWGCIREGIYFCRVSPSHLTQTGFLPYGSRQLRALPECPANAIGTEHLTGFALDWSGQRVYWCHGHTPTSVCLGRGFRT